MTLFHEYKINYRISNISYYFNMRPFIYLISIITNFEVSYRKNHADVKDNVGSFQQYITTHSNSPMASIF
jgi:hypothetical protein